MREGTAKWGIALLKQNSLDLDKQANFVIPLRTNFNEIKQVIFSYEVHHCESYFSH